MQRIAIRSSLQGKHFRFIYFGYVPYHMDYYVWSKAAELVVPMLAKI